MRVTGKVVAGDECFLDYPAPGTLAMDCLRIWPIGAWETRILTTFEVPDAIVTSAFYVVDPHRGRLFVDQSYEGADKLFPMRPAIADGSFTLDSDPVDVPGRTLLVGGPLDGVWYHWLFNWAPRLLLARRLRPALFDDPATRIGIHPKALEEPFLSVLKTFGVPLERYVAIDTERDHRLERAVLVSFPEERRLFRSLIFEMARIVPRGLGAFRRPGPGRRIFASRQALPHHRRRIANFDQLAPVLAANGFEVVDTGRLSAKAQATLFRNADFVMGGHGSDLSNVLFCRPGTKVVVFEHTFSVHYKLHLGLQYVAELMGCDYSFIQTDPWRPTGEGPPSLARAIDEDYLVDVAKVAAMLDRHG